MKRIQRRNLINVTIRILIIVAAISLLWFGYAMVQRGYYADSTGTSGYPTAYELILLGVSVTSFSSALIMSKLTKPSH